MKTFELTPSRRAFRSACKVPRHFHHGLLSQQQRRNMVRVLLAEMEAAMLAHRGFFLRPT